MNKEIKKLWIDALRGGEYKKGIGELHPSEDTYCCLGVLTDLYCKQFNIFGDNLLSRGTLPSVVMDWADLISSDPRVNDINLSEINDDLENHSFSKIADLIEEYL